MRDAASKLGSLERVSEQLKEARSQGRTVALANGCFDVLHVGHVRYLQGAGAEADVLVVGSTATPRAAAEGRDRPLLPAGDRALLVARCARSTT
jgi:cytidyltransferase-like protein